MRPLLEYGDNFPVPTGSPCLPAGRWNPAVPWRFPNTESKPQSPSFLSVILPWITLGLGLTLGVLWMSWRADGPGSALGNAASPTPAADEEVRTRPPEVRDFPEVPGVERPGRRSPVRVKSELA